MDYILYMLLIPAACVLGIIEFTVSCQGNNCTSTDRDEGEIDLYSVGPDLRELHLEDCNNLTVLELTPNLRSLEIAGCSWGRFRMTALRAVGNLSTLRFRDGRLLKLDRNLFAQLPHLEILELGANDIVIISADTFKGLHQLWMLALNDNKIIMLEDTIFNPLSELRYLDLSNNRFFKLPDAVFDNNLKLQQLLLRGNHFFSLNPYTLAILKNLVLLDLSNINMNKLQLLSAESMILDNGRIHRMDVLGNVVKFQARNNHLEYLHFEKPISVTELDLHGNNLRAEDMSNILKGMWRLERLDLSANLASVLPTLKTNMFDENEVFILPSLRIVNISSNHLDHLDGDSPLLSPILSHLDLSYNKICAVDPNIFSMLNGLQSLHIEGNRLNHFPYDLFHKQQHGLKEVALYGNEFSYDGYKQITQYFKEAGVHVIERGHSEGLISEKKKSSVEKCERAPTKKDVLMTRDEQIGPLESSDTEQRQFGKLHLFRKFGNWNFLILLSLMAALALNTIFVIQLRRTSGKKA